MANFQIKFIANDDDSVSIQTFYQDNQIIIKLYDLEGFSTICLDKSTAIKFAKTLRTEINKINE